MDGSAPIQDQGCLLSQHQADRPLKAAYIDGFKVRIEHQYRLFHDKNDYSTVKNPIFTARSQYIYEYGVLYGHSTVAMLV